MEHRDADKTDQKYRAGGEATGAESNPDFASDADSEETQVESDGTTRVEIPIGIPEPPPGFDSSESGLSFEEMKRRADRPEHLDEAQGDRPDESERRTIHRPGVPADEEDWEAMKRDADEPDTTRSRPGPQSDP